MSEDLNRKIKTITLHNFQNHKYSKINLTDGLNLLVGSSDSGKTAIARAIDFVIHNNSEGNDYVHIGEKFATVEIEFCDGAVIKRSKGERLNKVEYKFAEEEEFTVRSSFGDAYKEDVLNFLGNPPKSKLLGSMAYSNQSNKNFLVDLPESQLPGVISDLVGVSDLEEGSHLLSTKVKSLDVNIKSVEKEIVNIQNQLDEDFIGLDDDVSIVEKIKQLIEDIDELERTKLLLKNYYDKFVSIAKRGNEAKYELDKSLKIIDALSDKMETLNNLMNNLSYQHKTLSKHEECFSKIETTEKELDKYKSIADKEFKDLLDFIVKNNELLLKIYNLNSEIVKNQNNSFDVDKSIKDFNTKISNISQSLNDTIDEAKEKGLYCNSCNRIGGVKV